MEQCLYCEIHLYIMVHEIRGSSKCFHPQIRFRIGANQGKAMDQPLPLLLILKLGSAFNRRLWQCHFSQTIMWCVKGKLTEAISISASDGAGRGRGVMTQGTILCFAHSNTASDSCHCPLVLAESYRCQRKMNKKNPLGQSWQSLTEQLQMLHLQVN